MDIRMNEKWILDHLPPRPRQAHKGSLGTLTILAGSSAYRGAACLAAEGALRAGVGIARLASIEKVCAAAAVRIPACILHPLAENEAGGIQASPGAPEALLAQKSTALLAGCGMGNTADTAQWVQRLLETAACPVLLDADALNVLAGFLDTGSSWELRQACMHRLDAAKAPVVLTPHIGEMARLSGLSPQAVAASQSSVAMDFALAHRCVVVLKSHVTVIAAPDKTLYINDDAGNPGMARGGSGDVLSGIIASLLAQGLRPQAAAAAGVWLHATAGDYAAAQSGQAGLSPADIPSALTQVWKRLER